MPEDGKAAFVKLLQNKITVDGQIVPILTQFYPDDTLPAISMTQQAYGGEYDKGEFYNFDEDDYVESRSTVVGYRRLMSLHVWAINPDQRDNIYNQLITLLEDAKHWHYSQCYKYNPVTHNCSETNAECDARTHLNLYSINGKCPYPNPGVNYRAPETILHHYNIDNQITIRNPDFSEDLSMRPELYKITLDIEYNYFDIRTRNLAPTKDVEYEETIEE